MWPSRCACVAIVLLAISSLTEAQAAAPTTNLDVETVKGEGPTVVAAGDPRAGTQEPPEDEGHHPFHQTYGQQKEYGKGTGRPDGGWGKDIKPSKLNAGDLRTEDVGSHHLTLAWKMPKENGAIIEGYIIEQMAAGGQWELTTQADGETTLAVIVKNLKGNTKYSFRVTPLFNHGQKGITSDPTSVTTKAGKPWAPVKPYATDITLTSMMLHWVAPPNDGGEKITGYHVEMQEDAETTGGSAFYEKIANTKDVGTAVKITGLKPGGHVYVFRVSAINKVGMGRASVSSLAYQTLHTKKPKAPPMLSAESVDTTTIRLTWDEADGNGDKPFGYKVQMQTDDKGPFKVIKANTGVDEDGHKVKNPLTWDATKLIAGHSYKFSVQAVNKHGPGPKSYTPLVMPKQGVPEKIKRPPAVGQVTDSSCVLEWDKTGSGGSPLTGYRIFMRTKRTGGFPVKVATTGSTATTYKITGLVHGGTMYEFTVAGINANGVGPHSPSSQPIRTIYSSTRATAYAVKQAMDNFKQHNTLHKLWQLKMENERYNKKMKYQRKVMENAKEMTDKAQTLATQLQMRLEIQIGLASKKLRMESKLGKKNTQLQIDVWHSKRDLLIDKYDKLVKEIKKKASNTISEARAVAKMKMDKLSKNADKVCNVKLTSQKGKSDRVIANLRSAGKKRVTELDEKIDFNRKQAAALLERTKAKSLSRLETQRKRARVRMGRVVDKLNKKIRDLSGKLPKLPTDKRLKAKRADAALAKMKSVKLALDQNGSEKEQKEKIGRAQQLQAKKATAAADADKAAQDAKLEVEQSKMRQAKAKKALEAAEKALKAAGIPAKGVEVQLGSAQLSSPIGIVDLLQVAEKADPLDPVNSDDKQRLLLAVEAAKQTLKTATSEVEMKQSQLQVAQQKATQLHQEVAQIASQIKAAEVDMATKQSRDEQEKKKADVAKQIGKQKGKEEAERVAAEAKKVGNKVKTPSEILSAKMKKIKAVKAAMQEQAERKALKNVQKVPRQPVLVPFGEACPTDKPVPTADEFMKQMPEFNVDLFEMGKERTKIAQVALRSSTKKRAGFLGSCEMQANCRALGGSGGDIDSANCDQTTMCSAGSVKANARPCKTCQTVFQINRWRSLNTWKMDKCNGPGECEATPLSWRFCDKDDHARDPSTCTKEDIGRKPAPRGKNLPVQGEVSWGHTHCTSCHDGDALEIVHPDTQTGICRPFGASGGSPNLNAQPLCHARNNMAAVPTSNNQVCNKIYRPAVLFAGNDSYPFLINHNKYAYVTCNVRKMVSCSSEGIDGSEISARPANGGLKQMHTLKLQCKTEKQVSCANVCRTSINGKLCSKGDDCTSGKSWTPLEARNHMRSKLMSTSYDLSTYDCDPGRCSHELCQQAAMAD